MLRKETSERPESTDGIRRNLYDIGDRMAILKIDNSKFSIIAWNEPSERHVSRDETISTLFVSSNRLGIFNSKFKIENL